MQNRSNCHEWQRPFVKIALQRFHFHLEKFLSFWRNLRNFERLEEFFKEFQKFKEFQGNLRKDKEIIQKFREFKEIWVKYKEIESNSRINHYSWGARSRILFDHVITAENNYKRA